MRGRLVMSAAAITALGACAPSLRGQSPVQLYEALVAEGTQLACVATEDSTLHEAVGKARRERLEKARPWLVAEIGAERMAKIREEAEEAQRDVYYVGCPSVEHQQRGSMRYRRLLREIERRARAADKARQAAALSSPSGTSAWRNWSALVRHVKVAP